MCTRVPTRVYPGLGRVVVSRVGIRNFPFSIVFVLFEADLKSEDPSAQKDLLSFASFFDFTVASSGIIKPYG